jgi:ABC-type multidrug transport system fused ATPase/permease subunit
MNYHGGWSFLFLSNLFMMLCYVPRTGLTYVLGLWTTNTDQKSDLKFYSIVIFSAIFFQAFAAFLHMAVTVAFSWKATKKLHREMIKAVSKAPVNLFFDCTPIGRILNKFSKDLSTLETE